MIVITSKGTTRCCGGFNFERMSADLGIEDHRLDWNGSRPPKVKKSNGVVNEMTTQIKALRPAGHAGEIPRMGSGNDRLARHVEKSGAAAFCCGGGRRPKIQKAEVAHV